MARKTFDSSDSPSSDLPPRYPAATPTMIDSIVATTPATMATIMVARAPTSNCEKMSCPRAVVPSQWLDDGVRSAMKLVALGL